MKKKRFTKKKQIENIYLQLLERKQNQIDSINSLLNDAYKDSHRQMATTRYLISIYFMIDTLAKTLDEDSPMGKLILNAINSFKITMAASMNKFRYNGERCSYASFDEDAQFDYDDN